MQLTCPHCQQLLEFSGPRPGFCGFCGQRLDDTKGTLPDTEAYSPAADIHVAETITGSERETGGGPAAQPRQTFGEYCLVRELGQGGMGVVWEAEQAETGRRVALKLLSPNLPRTNDTVDRFLREARLAASLSHPRSTFVFGAGQHQDQPFIVMELMPGRTLKDIVDEQGALPVNRSVDYILDVIEGLEAAHALGVIHRDVKPSNCFLDSDGRLKVGDFGLSKSLVSEASLTTTGTFLGTPQFAAPEQVRGATVDERTDMYAVGATLFFLIANRGPFVGDPAAVIAQVASDRAPSLRSVAPHVPPSLARIVARSLEKDPERRFSNLAQLRQALLPFASEGTSIADVGRRLAAYMLDAGMLVIAGTIAGVVFVMLVGMKSGFSHQQQLQALLQMVWIVCQMGYFALAEGLWGCGVGKLLMGLRVVGLQGERAGIARCLVRAVFIPGALGLKLAAPIYTYMSPEPAATAVTFDAQQMVVHWAEILMLTVPWLVILACLATMRKRNGYRGLHELASGTRVVRLRKSAAASPRHDVPTMAPVTTDKAGGWFGPYCVTGRFGRSGPCTVFDARDEHLNRAVWIYAAAGGEHPISVERARIARPTRPFWLQGGRKDGTRWDAFEAVIGAPLSEVPAMSLSGSILFLPLSVIVAPLSEVPAMGHSNWEQGRSLLVDLAEELAAAVADGTLPERLSLDQVWVDRGGRVKLLDGPLERDSADGAPVHEIALAALCEDLVPGSGEPGYGGAAEQAVADAPAEAVTLLISATESLTKGQLLPGHAQQFVAELARRPADRTTLDWAAGQLRELASRPAALRWDDRLGILAASMGTEFIAYQAFAMAAPLLMLQVLGGGAASVALSMLACLALPAISGYAFRGGPVFRFLGIEVRRRDGRLAGRARCAWRSFVAWIPVMFIYGMIGLMATHPAVLYASQQTDTEVASEMIDKGHWQGILLMAGVCSSLLLFFLAVLGTVYAIIRPQRGRQDILAGTCLVPK